MLKPKLQIVLLSEILPQKKPLHPFGIVGAELLKQQGFSARLRRTFEKIEDWNIVKKKPLSGWSRVTLFGKQADVKTIAQIKQLAQSFKAIARAKQQGSELPKTYLVLSGGKAVAVHGTEDAFNERLVTLLKRVASTPEEKSKVEEFAKRTRKKTIQNLVKANKELYTVLRSSGFAENSPKITATKEHLAEIVAELAKLRFY